MEDLNRRVHLTRLLEEFRDHVEWRDFVRLLETCEDIQRLRIDDDRILQYFSLIWNNWTPPGGFSSDTVNTRKAFLSAKQREKPGKCIEYILQEMGQDRFYQTFEYMNSIIELPPYCQDAYLNGYFGLMAWYAYSCPHSITKGASTVILATEKQRESWAKLATKHFELARHCDFVFDYWWATLLIDLNRCEEAISLLYRCIESFHKDNYYLIRLLFEIGSEADKRYAAALIMWLSILPNDFDIFQYLGALDKVYFLIGRLDADYGNLNLWTMLKETLDELTELEMVELTVKLDMHFVVETWMSFTKFIANDKLISQTIAECIARVHKS